MSAVPHSPSVTHTASPDTVTPGRALELDVLRVLSLVAMATLHLLSTWRLGTDVEPWASEVARSIHDACQFCVPVLFLVSLVLAARRPKAASGASRSVMARVGALARPTFTWLGLYWLVGLVLQSRGLRSPWIFLIPLGEGPLATAVLAVHLWFMLVLLQMEPLVPLVNRAVERLTGGRASRAVALAAGVFVLKAGVTAVMFQPSRAALAGWLGLTAPFWLDLMVLGAAWPLLQTLLPQRPSLGTLAVWGVLMPATAVMLDAMEVRYWVAQGVPDMLAHSNWRVGNLYYSITLFTAVVVHKDWMLPRLSFATTSWLMRFSQSYAYAFYLAHALFLITADLLAARLGWPPAPRLVFMAVLTFGGTAVFLALLRRAPRLGVWLGMR
ncbi:acyltransferase [Pyxidicoccus parkwayensis]|uniref:Acyltransferase n=1 Tax=Pyxidicoccus parkwayensis TaxID=2813578 RepID=A0ABX7P5C7_9BACT|nr:acyltransferase [Pyxidicoccus parkwaysis]QSQ25688.1 acyltransferase [Pyxidicoccus parkwaysis]